MTHSTQLDFDALLDRIDQVRALASRLVRDAVEADEVVAEAFARVAGKPIPLGPGGDGWLATVLRNIVRDRVRRKERRLRRERVAARPEALESAADTAERLERNQDVVGAVLSLDEPYRTAILLRFFDGEPVSRIAERTGHTVDATNKHVQRGKLQLRRKLEQRYGDRGQWAVALLPLIADAGAGAPAAGLGAAKLAGVAGALLLGSGLVAQRAGLLESPQQQPRAEAEIAAPLEPRREPVADAGAPDRASTENASRATDDSTPGPSAAPLLAERRPVARLDLVPLEAELVTWATDVQALRQDLQENNLFEVLRAHPCLLDVAGVWINDELMDLANPAEEVRNTLRSENRFLHELLALANHGAAHYALDLGMDTSVDVKLLQVSPDYARITELLVNDFKASGRGALRFEPDQDVWTALPPRNSANMLSPGTGVVVGDQVVCWIESNDGGALAAESSRLRRILQGRPSSFPTLAGSEVLEESTEALESDGQLHLLLRPNEETRARLQQAEGPEAQEFVEGLGLHEIEWVRAALSVGEAEQLDLEFALDVPKHTLIQLFAEQLGPLPLDLLERLPFEAHSYLAANWNPSEFLASLSRSTNPAVLALAGLAEVGLAVASSALQVSAQDALLRPLTGRMARAAHTSGEGSTNQFALLAELSTAPSTWILETRDPGRFEAGLLSSIEAIAPDAALDSVRIDGSSIMQPDAAGLTRHWAVDGPFERGYAVFSSSDERTVSTLRSMLEAATPIHRDTALREAYRRASSASAVHVAPTAEFLPPLLDLVEAMKLESASTRRQFVTTGQLNAAKAAFDSLAGTIAQSLSASPGVLRYRLQTR